MWSSHSFFAPGLLFLLLGIAFASATLLGLGVFLLSATLLARWWTKHALDDMCYERIMSENRAFENEVISLTLRLRNEKVLPVPWLSVLDSVPEGTLIGETQASVSETPGYVYLERTAGLGGYERIDWPLQLRAPGRGYYRLGPARWRTGDIFGFYPTERETTQVDPIIVYPRLYALPKLSLPAGRPFGGFKGHERIFEDPGRIAGMRDYQPGDPMRRIDWKASARRQSLQSRIYEPSASMHLLIALNVHTTATTFGFVTDSLERLLSVTASVAYVSFEDGYALGLIANGAYLDADRPMRIPIGRSADQLMRILEALAVIGPLTTTTLETAIDREARSFPFGGTLVCVTAQMGPALAASLRRVAGAGHKVTVLSVAEEAWEEDLGRIEVHHILDAVVAAEGTAQEPGAEVLTGRR